MDSFFNHLTDISLRRLYKFVLKRALGRYLADELLIEQLEVKSRDGVVSLHDIKFNADAINAEIADYSLPFRVVSLQLNKLDVYISYQTLLTDGCRFVADHIDVVLAPVSLSSTRRSGKETPSMKRADDYGANPVQRMITTEAESHNLTFLANWIEVVIARLQVAVKQVTVTFESEKQKHTASLQVELVDIEFFNEDPRSLGREMDASSVAMSQRISSANDPVEASAFRVKLGERKLLKLGGISICSVPSTLTSGETTKKNESSTAPKLIRCSQLSLISLKLEKDYSAGGELRGCDCDISVPALEICLTAVTLKSLLLVLSSYSSSSTGNRNSPTNRNESDITAPLPRVVAMERLLAVDPALKTILWLEASEQRVATKSATHSDGQDDVDFARVANLMKQYRLTRQSIQQEFEREAAAKEVKSHRGLNPSSSRNEMDWMLQNTVESDDEVSYNGTNGVDDHYDSDECSDDLDFFDALQGQQVNLHNSQIGRSLMSSSFSAGHTKKNGHNIDRRSKLLKSSAMAKSVTRAAAVADAVKTSTAEASLSYQSPSKSTLRLRLHVLKCDLYYVAEKVSLKSGHALCVRKNNNVLHLYCSDIIASSTSIIEETGQPQQLVSETTVNPQTAINHKCSLTIGELGMSAESERATYGPVDTSNDDGHRGDDSCDGSHIDIENSVDSSRVIVSFHTGQKSQVIYRSPHFELVTEFVNQTWIETKQNQQHQDDSRLDVHICLQPIVISVDMWMLQMWSEEFLQLVPLLAVADAESSTLLAVKVKLERIDCLLHADAEVVSSYNWQHETLAALNVDAMEHRNVWSKLSTFAPQHPFHCHLIDSIAGFRFQFRTISIRASSNNKSKSNDGNGSSPLAELGEASLILFVSVPADDELSATSTIIDECDIHAQGGSIMRRRVYFETAIITARSSNKKNVSISIGRDVSSPSSAEKSAYHEEDHEYCFVDDIDGRGSSHHRPHGNKCEDVGPQPPSIDHSSTILIDAYSIDAQLRDHEYNAMMMIGEALAPNSDATDSNDSGCGVSDTGRKSGGFGLQVTADVAKLILLESGPKIYSFPILEQLLIRCGIDIGAFAAVQPRDTSFVLSVSIIDPQFDLCIGNTSDGAAISADTCNNHIHQSIIYLSIRADDVYMFEMTQCQYEILCTEDFEFHHRDSTGMPCDPLSIESARYGQDKFRMPFIRRVNGGMALAGRHRAAHFSTLLSDNAQFGHAFEVRLLLSTSRTTISQKEQEENTTRNVQFYIDFHDIFLSHDPQSTWLLKVVHLLTPQNARRMLEHRRLQRYEQAARLFDALPCEQKQHTSLDAILFEEGDVSSVETAEQHTSSKQESSPGLPFEVTKLNVRIRDCIIDYVCNRPEISSSEFVHSTEVHNSLFESRVQLLIGLLTLNSTIVSNSPKISMKFKLAGISLRIGKVVLREDAQKAGASGGSTLRRLELNDMKFVEMAAMDRMDINMLMDGDPSTTHNDLSANDKRCSADEASLEGIVLLVDAGLCSISSCVDSIEVLSKSMQTWFRELKVACIEMEEMIQRQKEVRLLLQDVTDNLILSRYSEEEEEEQQQPRIQSCRGNEKLELSPDADGHMGEDKPHVVIPPSLMADMDFKNFHGLVQQQSPGESALDLSETGWDVERPDISSTMDMDRIMVDDFFAASTNEVASEEVSSFLVNEKVQHKYKNHSTSRMHCSINHRHSGISISSLPSEYEIEDHSPAQVEPDSSSVQEELPWLPRYDYDDASTIAENTVFSLSDAGEGCMRNSSSNLNCSEKFVDDDVQAMGQVESEHLPLDCSHSHTAVDDTLQMFSQGRKVESEAGSDQESSSIASSALRDLFDHDYSDNESEMASADEARYGSRTEAFYGRERQSPAFRNPRSAMSESIFGLANFSYFRKAHEGEEHSFEEYEMKNVASNCVDGHTSSFRDDISIEEDSATEYSVMQDDYINKHTRYSATVDADDQVGEHLLIKIGVNEARMLQSNSEASAVFSDGDSERHPWLNSPSVGPSSVQIAMQSVSEEENVGNNVPLDPPDGLDLEEELGDDISDSNTDLDRSICESKVQNSLNSAESVPAVDTPVLEHEASLHDEYTRGDEMMFQTQMVEDSAPLRSDNYNYSARQELRGTSTSLEEQWSDQVIVGQSIIATSVHKTSQDLNPIASGGRSRGQGDHVPSAETTQLSHPLRLQTKIIKDKPVPEHSGRWFVDPNAIEIFPHYIPLLSADDDLDDRRPDAEKELFSKLLVKLRCTLRVRVFEGTDWPLQEDEISLESHPREGNDTNETSKSNNDVIKPAAATNDRHATGSRHSVSFKSDELLRDLTRPQKPGSRVVSSSTRNRASKSNIRESSRGTDRYNWQSKGEPKAHADRARASPAEFAYEDRNIVDISAKDAMLCIRVYESNESISSNSEDIENLKKLKGDGQQQFQVLPAQRISISAQDFLISFGSLRGPRKKVLGYWKSLKMPRDIHEPMLQMVLLSYHEDVSSGHDVDVPSTALAATEYRLYITLLPLRCYLSDDLISFIKSIGEVLSSETKTQKVTEGAGIVTEVASTEQTSSGDDLYFQSVSIAPVQLKIDYLASSINFKALQSGDYSQLLNIFPLDGLEITLKEIRLNGTEGAGACINSMVEAWVRDIYANQLHRVVSGTAPFRGLSNIGSDLQELLTIPMNDFRKSGGTLTQLRRGTKSLLRTVARETFHASHKLTMFVANTITELTSDDIIMDPVQQQQILNRERSGLTRAQSTIPAVDTAAGSNRQPHGVLDGLNRARSCIVREVNAAAETVIAIPMRQNIRVQQGGGNTVLKSIIRAVPIAILRPMAGIAEGISYTMLGLRNDIDPGARIDEEDQWNVDIIEQQFPEVANNSR